MVIPPKVGYACWKFEANDSRTLRQQPPIQQRRCLRALFVIEKPIMIVPQPISTLQQWRQLCYVTTLDVHDVNHLLQLIAEGVLQGSGAQACTIMYRSLYNGTLRAGAGTMTPLINDMINEAESGWAPQLLAPVHREFAGVTLTSVPLTINGEYAGLLHLVMEYEAGDDDLQVLVVMLSNVLARHQTAQQALRSAQRDQQQHLAVQQAITRILAESATLSDATPVMLQAFCESLNWDVGELWSIDTAACVLRCTTFWHQPDLAICDVAQSTQAIAFACGEGLPGRVWQTNEPHWITDIVDDDTAPHTLLAAKYHLRSALGFPIRNEHGMQGVIVLRRRQIRPADHRLIGLLTAFGSQIGQFIERKRAEAGQREIEQQIRTIFEHASVGMAQVSLDGRWLRVNPRMCQILGYAADELIGQTFQAITHPDDLGRDLDFVQQLLADQIQWYTLEKRYIRKDTTLVWVNVTVSLLRYATGEPHYLVSVIEDITERKRAEEENQRLTEALRIERDRLLRREVEVRTQIGRDLHDGPVQQVAMAGMATQYVQRVAQRAPEMLPEALRDLEDQLKRATQDLRTVLYELRPLGITEEGLVVVLQQYISKLRDPSGLKVHFEAPASLRRLAPDHEAAMFIIIQEAINNVRKHAEARDVWLTLSDDGAALCATVQDNGRGFDVQQVQGTYIQRNSFGLLNMEERAQLSGGTCVFESTLGQGSRVHIRIPYTAPARNFVQ